MENNSRGTTTHDGYCSSQMLRKVWLKKKNLTELTTWVNSEHKKVDTQSSTIYKRAVSLSRGRVLSRFRPQNAGLRPDPQRAQESQLALGL